MRRIIADLRVRVRALLVELVLDIDDQPPLVPADTRGSVAVTNSTICTVETSQDW